MEIDLKIDQDYVDKLHKAINEHFDELKRLEEFFKQLDIPFNYSTIDGRELYKILNDPEKCKILISKLNNMAFW